MSLPKKKSRSITVNNKHFKYVVSRARTYEENWVFKLNIIVQIAHGEGSILKVEGLTTRDFWLDVPNDIGCNKDYPILTIKDISILIKNSINQGWNPVKKGSPFIIKLDNSFVLKHGTWYKQRI